MAGGPADFDSKKVSEIKKVNDIYTLYNKKVPNIFDFRPFVDYVEKFFRSRS